MAHITETNCCQNNCFQLSVTSLEIRLCSNKTARHLTGLETRSVFWLMKHLSSSVPIFGPRIVRTLTPSSTSFGESCRNGCIRSLTGHWWLEATTDSGMVWHSPAGYRPGDWPVARTVTCELVWKLVDDILNTCYDRLLLCFAFICNWVNSLTLASHFAALCLCQQWLYLTCFLLGLQLSTIHKYKIWNVYFVAHFLCYNIAKYF